MTVNPDHEDAHALLGWFDNEGKETSFQAHSHVNGSSGLGGGFNRNEMRSITEVKEAELGQADKPEYFSTRATIMHIRGQNIAYPACSGPNCSKKVVEVGNKWRCEKCNLEADEPTYRCVHCDPIPLSCSNIFIGTSFRWLFPTGLVRLGSAALTKSELLYSTKMRTSW